MTTQKHVAVLMGGWSAERPVSLVTGKGCAQALREEGFKVSEVDVGRDVAEVLTRLKPDVCFNALHGQWGEDGCIQGLLEILGIPYTHSGLLASAVAMHKERAKAVFRAAGLREVKVKVFSGPDQAGRTTPMQRASLAAYATDSGQISKDEIQQWLADIERAVESGLYLFILPQFVVRGVKA